MKTPGFEEIRKFFADFPPQEGELGSSAMARFRECDHPEPECSMARYFDYAHIAVRCRKCGVLTDAIWGGDRLVRPPGPPIDNYNGGNSRWVELPWYTGWGEKA